MASPTTAPARRNRPAHRLTVLRSERLTPHLVRVVLGGPGVVGIADNGCTDRYVKLAFPRPGVTYPEPLDVGIVRETMPRSDWPIMRTYTVRSLDHAAGEMAIDFVVHGDTGVAGRWALAAAPGDELVLQGPGGAYAPAADADAHVLIGDEAALPAIAAACERVAPGVPVQVFVQVDGPHDELALASPGALSVRWVHRDAGEDLADVVRDAPWPAGRVQAFVHGETGVVKALRGLVRDERGVGRELLSISGYWRRGMDEEAFQADKRAGNGVAA
ncbi:siderophore-interacting protein [Actinomycetospora sp. TBRC 11914]|uniref:siderophore-interacting protein n=1 Tax=Actinomycetospora sp. TBRC 11914 TaxID=2729387 RepID=UPI00145ED2AC|nr:siderophore-interacting protein [Actinomycetospora sp. TBRC 11914]NMO89977.1 siderophore-interacting protein [Actinomycetospora sp. TBRC 11914]